MFDRIEDINLMTEEDYTGLTAEQQSLILFRMMREFISIAKATQDTADLVIEKVAEYSTPEGLQKLSNQLMQGLMGGLR